METTEIDKEDQVLERVKLYYHELPIKKQIEFRANFEKEFPKRSWAALINPKCKYRFQVSEMDFVMENLFPKPMTSKKLLSKKVLVLTLKINFYDHFNNKSSKRAIASGT